MCLRALYHRIKMITKIFELSGVIIYRVCLLSVVNNGPSVPAFRLGDAVAVPGEVQWLLPATSRCRDVRDATLGSKIPIETELYMEPGEDVSVLDLPQS